MKIFVVSDIHYSLQQYDWLVKNAADFDLIIIAGDLLELASSVDPDTQASVVERYFYKIAAQRPLVVCSGNHDLIDDHQGNRTTEWLEDIDIPGLTVDFESFANDVIRIIALPWWETESEKARAISWLKEQEKSDDPRFTFWVHHAPPQGSKVSWNGKQHLGDDTLVEWIGQYAPTLILSGHVHNAPYYPDGSWIDLVGATLVVNGGKQPGEKPASIEIDLDERKLTWCGMEGSEEKPFKAGT